MSHYHFKQILFIFAIINIKFINIKNIYRLVHI